MSPVVEAWSLNHWTAREVPLQTLLIEVYLVSILLDTLTKRPTQMYWLINREVQQFGASYFYVKDLLLSLSYFSVLSDFIFIFKQVLSMWWQDGPT